MKKIVLFAFLLLLVIFASVFLIVKEKRSAFNEANWAYEYLKIDKLHDEMGLSGKDVRVALIDTGVAKKIPVIEGINVINDSNNYLDDHGHGTHIAGILASNELGVAPNIDLYAIKALDANLNGEITDIIKAIDWAISKEVDIILMPFGTFKGTSELESLIHKAAQEKDILFVSSVGNYGLQESIDILYPAKYDDVIAVGALDKEKDVWIGTTLGEELDYLLPGQYINSYAINNDYLVSSGTSMSSAYMAGLLALYVEKNKEKGSFNESLNQKKKEYSKQKGFYVLDPIKLLN